jgi:plasmid stabilization system protein ParE
MTNGLVSQSEAARVACVGLGQVRVWRRQRRLPEVYQGGRILFSVAVLEDVAEWAARSISEKAAARILRLLPTSVRALAEAGELGEWREYEGVREYEREAVERHAAYRSRLISMRQACREFALPWWVMAQLVESGTITTWPGAKGAKLVDPVDLKPLIEPVSCSLCGEPAPAGRTQHTDCKRRTPEARERARRNISAWWASPESAPFREKIGELPCPECGKPVRLTEPVLRHRVARNQKPAEVPNAAVPRVFCNQSCAAKYRWRKGIGLDAVVEALPGAGRRTVKGRWGGHKGAKYGQLGGRQPAAKIDLEYAEKAAEVKRLHQTNPRLGGRTLADRTGLSHRQVRAILSQQTNS